VNRLATASTNGPLYGSSYSIDGWGNLNQIATIAGKGSVESGNQIPNRKNQFTGLVYDAAGNLLSDDVASHGNQHYNAEGQIDSSFTNLSYLYDGNGVRVKKSTGMLYWGGTPTLAEAT
jgi:YD repeat-containing protein